LTIFPIRQIAESDKLKIGGMVSTNSANCRTQSLGVLELRQYFDAQKASFCDLRREHGKFLPTRSGCRLIFK